MPRFDRSRWWAFILTSSLCLACWCLTPGGAAADSPLRGLGDPSGGGVPTGTGDPDIPQGPKGSSLRGTGLGGATYDGMRAAGDGSVSRDVWVMRLRVVLQGAKSFYLRF
jgi:hypothetical protein